MSGPELFWAEAAEVTMPSATVLEILDVRRHVHKGQLATRVDVLLDALLLEAAEEGLGYGVVPAIPLATHTGLEVVVEEEAPPRIAAVLHALIRMDVSGVAR